MLPLALHHNKGAAGVDKQTLHDFKSDLENNLYKLWNRLASGSYMAPAVRRVAIPKAQRGVRPLGIPKVTDRIAQTVVRDALEPELERHYHPNSYGYRLKEALRIRFAECVLELHELADMASHDMGLFAHRRHVYGQAVGTGGAG